MINAIQMRRGNIIVRDGELFKVMKIDHVTPGKGNAFVRATLRNLRLGNQAELRLTSQEKVEKAHLDLKEMEYLYNDDTDYHFMDTESFEQIQLSKDTLGEQVYYLLPNTKVNMDFYEGNPVGVEFPKTVNLKIVECEPTVRRATASATFKNAKLETGLNVRVPNFVQNGETIKVDTESGEYVERV